MEEYIGLSQTPEGKRFNRVLFEAFDAMFRDISYGLGLASASHMAGQDI